MKRLKSLLAAALVALLSSAVILPIAACTEDDDKNNAIYVTSAGGMALQGVTVELSNGNTSLGAKSTDEKGKVDYILDKDTVYTAKLDNVPAGFLPEASYTVKGSDKSTYIRINSEIISEGNPSGYYKVGDVLYDFEQTYYYYDSASKKTVSRKAKLSDFLDEDKEGKKAVLLNFWYEGCNPCQAEMPSISKAYNKYADKIAVLGINDYSAEDITNVTRTVETKEIPYLMCKDNAAVGVWFQKRGWPLSVMIDRYGIMCETLTGTETEQEFWDSWFAKYTSDNYSQGITQGEEQDPEFVPDKPSDANVSVPNSNELTSKISSTINKTGKNVIFSVDQTDSIYSWPWDLTDDKSAIYPVNSGHRGTMATIYAQVDLEANEVFAFDYKLSTMSGYDYFYVSIDSRNGTGRQISMTSGVENLQTGYAYLALEAGRHEVAFSYYKSETNPMLPVDDKVYLNNLRIVTVDEMNEGLTEKNTTLEIPYFATRNYNNDSRQYDIIEDYYLADDGYYHIGTKATASESDPYLLLDITHATPFFGDGSLQSYISSSISLNGGIYFKGDDFDYTDTFRSFLVYSNNSDYEGLIPVNEDVRDTLVTLYNARIPAGAPFYNEDGWLQLCVYYKQFGVQKPLTDPIKGLTYFSAFEATETVGKEDYVEVEKGKGQFVFDEKSGHFVDVEGTDKAAEGNYDWNPTINKVHFDKVIMPRGYMYKFVPTKSGVYSISGIDCYYFNQDESVEDGEDTDAWLFNGDMKVSHAYVNAIAASDADRYERNNIPNSFKIIHYLEEGKTYYINVAFRVVETTGDFAFRIDWLGENHSYISQAASSVYTLDENNKMVLPLYCDPYYDSANDVWLDRKGGGTIFVDFTQLSSMFDSYTIEQILNENTQTAQYKFRLDEDIVYTTEDENGNPKTVTIHFDKDNLPDELKGLVIKDYTDVMREYLAKSKEGKEPTDAEYGLVPVNNELYGILQLYNAKFFGYDTPTEWLKACCYRLYVNANNPN